MPVITAEENETLREKVVQVINWIDSNVKIIDNEVALQLFEFLRLFNDSKNFQELFQSY